MDTLPKIVTERLRTTAVTAAHPDADLLTAFSERTLPERERSGVLEHLARCGECREIVALALPAKQAAEIEIRPARGRWFTWPQLRWGLAAVGVVAIVLVGVIELQRKQKPETVARSYDSPAISAQNETKTQPEPARAAPEQPQFEAKKAVSPTAAPSSPAETDTERKEFDRLDQFGKSEAPLQDKGVTSGGVVRGNSLQGRQLAHGPKVPTQFQQNQFAQNMNANAQANNSFAFQSAAPPPPPASASQEATKELAMSPTTSTVVANGELRDEKSKLDTIAVAGRSTAPLSAPGGQAGAEVARAKPATSVNAPQAQPQASGAFAVPEDVSNFSPSGMLAPESARWSINAAGGLQRSMDQGRTWQDVNVDVASGIDNGMGFHKAMKSRDRALQKDTANAKQKPTVFRAVAANGPDVWAGGSEGSLYHSTDSGAHWLQVLPSWRGIDLSGDIINLQFSDPQHGRIVTSSAEIWTTADGGQTWEKH